MTPSGHRHEPMSRGRVHGRQATVNTSRDSQTLKNVREISARLTVTPLVLSVSVMLV